MNITTNPIIFYPTAIIMILFAFMTVRLHNIFYSVLCATIVFFLSGVIFYILGSEYNAIIQIAIYGIAIPVILGLAVMFTDIKKDAKKENKSSKKSFSIIIPILGLLFIFGMLLLISPYNFEINTYSDITYPIVISSFAQGLFVKYVWAFELFSLILTIIIVGITILNKNNDKSEETTLCKK